MNNLRSPHTTTPTQISQINHSLSLRAKCDGYYINTSGTLNQYGGVLMVSSTPDCEVCSMIEFDVTSLPASATVTRVMLQLHVMECRLAMPEEAMTVRCYGYIGNGKIAVDNADAGSLAGFATVANPRLAGPVCLDVAPEFVQRARETGSAGVRLNSSASLLTPRANLLVLRSLENTHPEAAPILFIDYTVEDVTAAQCVVTARNDMMP